MPESSPGKKYNSPCCGYPTLEERRVWEICELCNWEDDGQDDTHADEVWGGPNRDYSLTKARENFKKYLIMHSPGDDHRLETIKRETERKVKLEIIRMYCTPSKNKEEDR